MCIGNSIITFPARPTQSTPYADVVPETLEEDRASARSHVLRNLPHTLCNARSLSIDQRDSHYSRDYLECGAPEAAGVSIHVGSNGTELNDQPGLTLGTR